MEGGAVNLRSGAEGRGREHGAVLGLSAGRSCTSAVDQEEPTGGEDFPVKRTFARKSSRRLNR